MSTTERREALREPEDHQCLAVMDGVRCVLPRRHGGECSTNPEIPAQFAELEYLLRECPDFATRKRAVLDLAALLDGEVGRDGDWIEWVDEVGAEICIDPSGEIAVYEGGAYFTDGAWEPVDDGDGLRSRTIGWLGRQVPEALARTLCWRRLRAARPEGEEVVP